MQFPFEYNFMKYYKTTVFTTYAMILTYNVRQKVTAASISANGLNVTKKVRST